MTIGHHWPGVPEPGRFATDRNSKMTDYEIVDANAENISSRSFCGYKDANNLGHRRKTEQP